MITAEQVADLRKGDVVEVVQGAYPDVIVRGPLRAVVRGELWVGDLRVTAGDAHPDDKRIAWMLDDDSTLTVVSRAPRLYVNHPRTEPRKGDVVRDAATDDVSTWMCDYDGTWLTLPGGFVPGNDLPARLRLLIDGETGQVVP